MCVGKIIEKQYNRSDFMRKKRNLDSSKTTRILLILVFASFIAVVGCKKEKDSDEDKMKIPEFEMVFGVV